MRTVERPDGLAITTLEWSDVDELARRVAEQLRLSAFEPEVIIGVLRGGVIPMLLLSHLLNVPLSRTIHIRTTSSDEPYATRQSPIPTAPGLREIVANRRVLLTDDVANTGRTLDAAIGLIRKLGCAELRTAILVRDTWGGVNSGADYVGVVIPNWIEFPWEVSTPSTSRPEVDDLAE